MNHIEEHILELYVLGAPEAQDRARDIEEHLNVCAGCRELHGEITAYHHEVGVIAEELARKASEAIVVRAEGAEPALRADPAGGRQSPS